MEKFEKQPDPAAYDGPPVEPQIEENVPDSDKREKDDDGRVQDSIGDTNDFLERMKKMDELRDKRN